MNMNAAARQEDINSEVHATGMCKIYTKWLSHVYLSAMYDALHLFSHPASVAVVTHLYEYTKTSHPGMIGCKAHLLPACMLTPDFTFPKNFGFMMLPCHSNIGHP